ncbi:MAG: hypothetical protein OIN86_11110 [Candidatus Methanoperedens sp.]|nr:hypothetical protein [Candidatus Methanoperedens sp.]CAG0994109.1 hypothetical protein METP1_02461 [Methanosarcinales archaeon]
MDSITKFNGIDYTNTFAKRISVMHELVKNILSGHLNKGDVIIDIGGGPGIGAKIIDNLGIETTVINIEPSTTINEIPQLSSVKYIPLKMTFKEALDAKMPCAADCLLVVSSEHEIALCNGQAPKKNKKIFFEDMKKFIHKNLKKNGIMVFGFPNYREGASEIEIDRQRRLTESLLGHSHPKEEFFTVEEFSSSFSAQPVVCMKKPMNLANENPEETILRANVAVFKI